ncbi:MAG: hypothetical protein JXJ22_06175 [Bacteroidales bacterium]|nr:hypothetical protein [Bacteroidales bacterium]
MQHKEFNLLIEKLLAAIEELVPAYLANHEDRTLANGGAAVCILDETGTVYGKMFGTNKIIQRERYRFAWTKASQVWITGYKTNEYEKLVFANKIDHHSFGINMPDMIGWEGGQPITLKDGTKLSVGFSGFRGTSDLEIVIKAFEKAGINLK